MVTDATTYILDEAGIHQAEMLVTPAVTFCDTHGYPLGATLIRRRWQDAPAQAVVDALAAYQNADGGFGHELEVDIKSPVSNPFAARLAMQVLLSVKGDSSSDLRTRLGGWLQASQNADGDWHFAAEIYDSPLPFWYAGWTFPSLNPACCLAGLAVRLGVATPEMLDRVRKLFDERASLEEARNGEFYNVLPYAEYLPAIDRDARDEYLDAIAQGIVQRANGQGYADAGHFFEHTLGGGPDLVRRIPAPVIAAQTARLLGEVQDDGGWPTPYDTAWRPWQTANALITLARLRDGA